MSIRRSPDFRGAWHHVTNRGIARRTIFESRADVRRFLALVAREVRRGAIELHAYCIMSTHFHLLVVSRDGRLPDTMRRIESAYARWFNRTRRRDGPLFRGPYTPVEVRSDRHRAACVTYIDRNPVDAHVVATASSYPWGSASAYSRPRGPRWLTRSYVEAMVADRGSLASFDPARYEEIVSAGWSPELKAWIERTLRRRTPVDPQLDDLVRSAPDAVRSWMDRKARLADGTSERTVVVAPSAVVREIAAEAARRAVWDVVVRRRRRCAWAAMRSGLLRLCAGSTLAEVAAVERISTSAARRREGWHHEAMRTDAEYAHVAARVVAAATSRQAGESVKKCRGTVPLSG